MGLPLASCLQPVLAQAQSVSYTAPIVITQGGTYTGNYQSNSSSVPCVRINTTAPVILEGCNLSGAGNLIEAGSGTNLTVRNCRGQGLTPTVDNQAPGRFLDVYQAQRLVIEHNFFTQTSGIVINRWSNPTAGQTLTVRYNQARNIDGRWRNAGGSTRSSFLLLNTVQHLVGAEIAYNEVINTADQSLVEDNINLYNSSGTAQSPLRVHDNFVRGAYPFPATASGFTGSGLTTDGDDSTVAGAASYIEADHNQFIGTGNAAMNLAAGHDVYYHDNRAVTAGTLPDGRRFSTGWAGLGVFNYYNQPAGVYGNNRVENNTVGYVRWGASAPFTDRQDLSPGACVPCTGTISLPNPITTATEDAEYNSWQQKLQQNSITVGVIGTPAPTPAPSPTPSPAGVVVNPGFEDDGTAVGSPTGWQTQTGNDTNDNADYTESYAGAHGGTYHGTHYRPARYEVYTYQRISNLPAGTYTFRAWVKSGGGQPQAELRARNYGGANLTTAITGTNGNWQLLEIGNIAVTNGQCEIGFYSNAQREQWFYFDDVTFAVQTAAPATAATVLNASFDDDQAAVQAPSRWATQTWGSTQAYASYTEAYSGAHTGTYHGTHYRPEGYEVYTHQTVTNLAAGTYTLRAWVKSGGGQAQAELRASGYGGTQAAVAIPATTNGQWTQVTLPGIVVSTGQCDLGFYSRASGGQWLYFDDVELVQGGTGTGPVVTPPAAAPSLYPNPANDEVTITADFAQAGNVVFLITNWLGIPAAQHWRQSVPGSNQFTLTTTYLPNGIYTVQVVGNSSFPTLRLQVSH